MVWLGVSLVAPEKPYPKEAYPTHRLTPKKGRQDNPSKSCIIEEERFSKSRRFLCVKNVDFLVFAGIPTWGYLWPIACPFIKLNKMGKSGRGRRTFQNGSPYSKLRGDSLQISEAIGQVMVINGEDALPSSSENNAPEEPRKEEHTSEYLE